MKWNADNDKRLAGLTGSADSVLTTAEQMAELGLWPSDTVLRVRGGDGRAVWLSIAVTRPGNVYCLGVAPWGEPFERDIVTQTEWFQIPLSESLVTKARAGLVERDWSTRRRRRSSWEGAEWAVALYGVAEKPRARRCVLYKVVRASSVGPEWVQALPHAPPVPAASQGAAAWLPQADYPDGYATLWAREDTEAGSYLWHATKAKRAAGIKLGKKAAKKA